jgi:hypothetical protein
MNHKNRGHWYLLTGLILGIILGLMFTWLIQPVEYTETEPATLRDDFKNQYRAMIALAYIGNQDIVRAKARLDLLGDDDQFKVLSEQAQMTLAENGSIEEARALGLLAVALGSELSMTTPSLPNLTKTKIQTSSPIKNPSSTNIPPSKSTSATNHQAVTNTESTETILQTESPTTSTEIISTPTETLATLNTPLPKTNIPTISAPTPKPGFNTFVLESQVEVCEPPLDIPLFQIYVEDTQGNPIPGVLVIIYWEEGEDRFFTGLKPEKGLGYADYSPKQEMKYTLRLSETGQPIKDLIPVECTNTYGEKYWGALSLTFVQQ